MVPACQISFNIWWYLASGWNATDSNGQAEIMLGVVSKNTEQTVSTALQETGDHVAMRLVELVDNPCDPVVLDGFPSIFVSFRGILWHFTWDDVYYNWFKVQPTKPQNTTFTMMTVNLWDCWCKCRIHSNLALSSKSLESERLTKFKWVKDGKGM